VHESRLLLEGTIAQIHVSEGFSSIGDRATAQIGQSASPAGLPSVSPELEARFLESHFAYLSQRPGSSLDIACLPLKEGFDALIFHFDKVRSILLFAISLPNMLALV
jgi:hypothetical protein